MTDIGRMLQATAQRVPDHPAVRLESYGLTYRELDALSSALAGRLSGLGLRPGDRVALMLPNVLAWPVAYYGILRAGGVVVPANPLLKPRELDYLLDDSGSRFIVSSPDVMAPGSSAYSDATVAGIGLDDAALDHLQTEDPIEHPPARDSDDTAVILYTSGTTGRPKGAELTHDSLIRNATVTAETLLCLRPDDVVLGCLPLFHSFGQTCTLNASVLAGSCLTLLTRFDPERALEIIDRDSVTVFAGVPTMYSALLLDPGRDGADAGSLRVCVSGGAALPVEVLHEFEAAFATIILEGYGLSETSPVACFNHPDRPRRPGSIGTPIQGVELRLVDESGQETPPGEVGEIAIRGHNVMKGYWRQPDATAQVMSHGWFRTGDLARRDEEGYYYIVDRKKDLIIRGGYNVYPREVEEVLYEHPAVSAVAVVGIPDPSLGEEVGAAVSLKHGASASGDELREFVKARCAAYKYPRHIWFVDYLPQTATGKIIRREVQVPAALLTT